MMIFADFFKKISFLDKLFLPLLRKNSLFASEYDANKANIHVINYQRCYIHSMMVTDVSPEP